MMKKIFFSWFAVLILWSIFYVVTMNRRNTTVTPKREQLVNKKDSLDTTIVVFKKNP